MQQHRHARGGDEAGAGAREAQRAQEARPLPARRVQDADEGEVAEDFQRVLDDGEDERLG